MSRDRPPRRGAALVVGIGRYHHTDAVPPLRYAGEDARAVAAALTNPHIGHFPPDRVSLVTDAEATRRTLADRLATWLPEQARGQEIVVVYFAGHGLVEKGRGGEEGYLVAHDSDPRRLADGALAMSDLTGWLKKLDAGAVVLCLDCCHAGKAALRHGVALRAAAPPEPEPFRDLVLRPAQFRQLSGQGRFLLASCGEGETSLEADELGHGLFTFHLLRGLEGRADRDGDGKVGVAELFEFVAAHVERDAREKFRLEQRPWHQASGTGGVYLAEPRRRDAASAADLDAVLREDGAAAAVAAAERLLGKADATELVDLLRFLRRVADPAAVPVLFRYLPHTDPVVREQAKKALHAVGWDKAAAAVKAAARDGDADGIRAYLAGLRAFEAHREVVALLKELIGLLHDDLRGQAYRLLEHKSLGLELDDTRRHFEAANIAYKIHKVLGQGLFASAYLAVHERTGLRVVVRVLRPELERQPLVRAAFLDLTARSLRYVHQNLAMTRELYEFPAQELCCVVRDYVDGVTLQRLLDSGETLAPPRAVEVVRRVLKALRPAHAEGQAHGGVKPSNVFLTADDRVVLGDPSLTALQAPGATRERLAYDYRYLAPEVFRGAAPGPATDLYAAGCLLYELLRGRPPFVSDNPFELAALHDRADVPPLPEIAFPWGNGLNDVLARLLAKAPEKRGRRADEVIDALSALTTAPPAAIVPAPSQPAPEAPPRLIAESVMGFSVAPGQTVFPSEEGPKFDVGPPRMPHVPGYQILDVLGRGGMGVVYKVRQASLGRIVALKMILAGSHAGDEALTRFHREAVAIARLQHPGIVQVLEIGQHEGIPYFTLEFCAGGSLQQKLAGRPLPPVEAAALVEGLARAIHHAHEAGVVHRDLKPSNVLLAADGTPKVTDFGLAKRLDAPDITTPGTVLGSPWYMAPEQVRGEGRLIGPATDVYALGAILYECLTGRPPFRAPSLSYTMAQVLQEEPTPPSQLVRLPRDIDTICLKCLQKEPGRRYGSAAALAEDLHCFLTGEPVMARPVGVAERAWRWCRRNPDRAMLLSLLGLLFLAAVVWGSVVLWGRL